MKSYRVTFKDGRIGRTRGNEPAVIEVGEGTIQQEADAVAEAVFRMARTKLVSKGFEVLVDIDGGTGSIGAGRYGSFTVEACR
jgi:hypothetical protein